MISLVDEAKPDRIFELETRRGERFRMPLWQLMNHTVNYSTYHRGQLAKMVRMLEHKPVATDMVIYFQNGLLNRGKETISSSR
ncbi:hypothetical protein HNV11_12700 [Spirosoma taeanense]|uniref:DinB family protein n=1 Tax=Spirosoma taeanense TaxID=2735870 RepID=A0A6M5YAE4_9BACT|nr:DinB family protein [Spirosoma taeanense]QJW90173.1 hypothetical protein HNV11_12700 [Spirosoma taeanense]